jgi:hypothetical protein
METPITTPPKKFKVTLSGRKLMATVISGDDLKGVLLVDVLDCGDMKC